MHNTNEILNLNNEYIPLVAQIMEIRKRGNTPLAYVRTYGCQQNVADSEQIKGLLGQMGYDFTENPEEADFILFNTCAVREHAEDRVFGNVGALKSLKRKHPSVLIALCGCMMEQKHIAERIYKSFPFVGLVFGTNCIHQLPKLMYDCLVDGKRLVFRGNDDTTVYENIPVKRDGTFKAWLPIMYGCDNFCTYCIVPYVRGRERSRNPEIIISQAKELIAKGYKETTLLGQNVNSYNYEGVNFTQLLQKISKTDKLNRIRFMTNHPKDFSDELIEEISNNKKICRHIHLPLQCSLSPLNQE